MSEEQIPAHTQTPPTQSDPGTSANQITFHSSTLRLDTFDAMTDPNPVGTIGFNMFTEVHRPTRASFKNFDGHRIEVPRAMLTTVARFSINFLK